MPQQINLCTPIFLTEKRYFSANTMVQALAVFLVLGGALCAYWAWSLSTASATYGQSIGANQREIEGLQAAIRVAKANAGPPDAALVQDLQVRRSELLQRAQLLAELKRGLVSDGDGPSARLRLVAQSVPVQVWVTEVRSDDVQFELKGFTLEPVALNEWVARLAASTLLQGQKLSTVKVERAGADLRNALNTASGPVANASVAGGRAASPEVWSFMLVSTVAAPAVTDSGGRP